LIACSLPAAMPESAAGPWLAVDYGSRRIGLALGHRRTGLPRPLAPLNGNDARGLESGLRQVLEDWRPQRIVVGLPLALDGQETRLSQRARSFASWLERVCAPVPVDLFDERLSSHFAARDFAERRRSGNARRRQSAQLDSLAAVRILESWMGEHGLL